MKPNIIIIGAGGHGKVVYDAILAQNKFQVLGFVDSVLEPGTIVIHDVKVICKQSNIESLNNQNLHFIVAIGNNDARAKVYESLKNTFKPATIIHPLCTIGSNVIIGDGTVVLANAVVNVMSHIGENTIVNTGVIVDHETNIGNHVYLRIGTIIGNNTLIPDFFTSDLGQIVQPFTNKQV